MAWSPETYLLFADDRARPPHDLIARIPPVDARAVVDVGCGPGNVTAMLRDAFPDAAITGLDNSAEMLAKARASYPDIAWVEADLRAWSPDRAPDVVFSNAVLQWLDDQLGAIARLFDWLAPGGALAIQMPSNWDEPWQRCLEALWTDARFADRLAGIARPTPPPSMVAMHGLLGGRAAHLDIWETTYLHLLAGDDPVVAWSSGTALRPALAALDDTDREAFVDAYRACTATAYPRAADGRTPFPFTRRFLVATKPA